ncbi:MAG: Response regulator receiver:Tetratricopeptide 4 [Proteobacteria bacterium]|nr:Response regulator receiver:Tetratricopeptide 4 [Pseudomonadota bacterium]
MDALDNEEMLLVLQQVLTKKRVLIVDRYPPARDSLRLMLSALGVTAVHGAGNSAEVIRQVSNNRFDIILSDFILEDGRDGQQLLEELRHNRMIALSTVYMIITGERSYTNVVSLAELAPDDYLIKPFTAEQLQIRLIRAIYKKHILHKVYQQIERGDLVEAIAACKRVEQQQPPYMYDALRFEGELLHTLGRHEEAEIVYRRVMEAKVVPWAKMGLAQSLKERGNLDEAEILAKEVTEEAPEYLSAYDFLSSVQEAQGKLELAQQALQRAADISPNNTVRQRLVGDIAARNKDLLTAEKAYGKVLERHRGSSLKSVDDFTNLSRVLVERGDVGASRKIVSELKREWRGDKQAEMASLVMESLCLQQEGQIDKAQQMVEQALTLHQQIQDSASNSGKPALQRLSVDLAHACLVSGKEETAQKILRQVAAENNEDLHIIEHITEVFRKTGNEDAGKAMLDQVGAEIITLNNRGVMAARAGDLEGAVELLIQAVEQVPNLQFLVNASKAIFTLIERKGWDQELAERGLQYLRRAQAKDARSPKVASARELYAAVAKKNGMPVNEALES